MDVLAELAAPAPRHGCKVCGKSFLCGRSLGGHMRSHVSLGDAALAEVHAAGEPRRASSPNGGRSCDGVLGYGLRENPRKTRRLSDFADEEEEEDGGGHGDGEHRACRECGKLFSSWRSLFRHMQSHASAGGGRYRDDDVEEAAEAEETEMVTSMEVPAVPAAAPAALAVLSALPRRKRRTMRVAATPPTWPPPPVLSGAFEKEPEDVALCLLMLSRDTGMRSSPSPAKEKPFESAKKKQVGLPRSGYAYDSDDDDAKVKGRVATKSNKSRKRGSSQSHPKQQQRDPVPVPVAPKRSRFECPGCGRAFSSYQALGGHRASHKRINASCSSPRVTVTPAAAPEEPSAETYASFDTLSPSASPDSVAIGFGKPNDVQLYYVGSSDGAGHQEQHSAAADGFLDLNFPPAAPEEEEEEEA